MRHAILLEHGKFVIEDNIISEAEHGEATIKIEACGICKSDIDVFAGKRKTFIDLPVVGHEIAGTVIKLGTNSNRFEIGDKVIVNPLVSCKKCYDCLNGNENFCEGIRVMGFGLQGGMREFANINENYLYKISEKISWGNAVLAEPLAVALSALHSAGIEDNTNVLVLGGGVIGYIISKLAKYLYRDINIIVLSKKRIWEKLYEDINCNICFDFSMLERVIDNCFGAKKADIVFDLTGDEEIINNTFKIIRRGSKIVLVGIPTKKAGLNFKKLQDRSLKVIGVNMYNNSSFQKSVSLINEGFSISEIITHTFTLEEIQKAFELADKNRDEVRKAIITVK